MSKTNAQQPQNGSKIAISWSDGFGTLAQTFAQENQLPIINELPLWRGLCFHLDSNGWAIISADNSNETGFALNFKPRHLAAGKDPLLKSMGGAQSILDLTAGWGKDAVHIARSGRQVVAVERHPVVVELLRQALASIESTELDTIMFYHLDAASNTFADQLSKASVTNSRFDLVYLDPMFSDKVGKHAKAKKPMRLLQQLTDSPNEDNESRLFENAMLIATKRVVVKRGLNAPFISQQKPQGSIKSKLLRFDLYKPE